MTGAVYRVAITRPVDDAARSAALLRSWGAEVLLEPLLVVMPAAAVDLSLDGVQAFLLTSANGARALASGLSAEPSLAGGFALPALCVGDQTMRTAKQVGFSQVLSAQGDVQSLATLVRDRLCAADGALLHAAGSVQAGDLAALLEGDGFCVRRSVLYETRTATAFSQDFIDACQSGAVDGVLFYSPRTAATFASLAGTATIGPCFSTISAYCLSPAVAEALGPCSFRAVRVAPQPTQDALFDLLQEDVPALKSGRLAVQSSAAPSLVPRTAQSLTNHGDRSMSDRPTASKADASAEAAAPTSVPAETPAVTPEPESTDLPGSEEPQSQAGAKPSAPPGGKGKLLGGGVAAVVVAGLAAYASLPWWVDATPPAVRTTLQKLLPAPAESETAVLAGEVSSLRNSLNTLQGQVSALQSRVTVLEEAPAVLAATTGSAGESAGQPAASDTGATGGAPQANAVAARLAALEEMLQGRQGEMTEALDAMKQELEELKASRASASAMLGLTDRVAGLEAAVTQAVSRQDRALAFLLAVGQLRTSIEGGRGFDAELKTVAAMAPAELDITGLSAGFAERAATGIPTLTALQQSFTHLGTQVIRASALPDETDSWWNRTVDRLLTVVTVRRIDGDAVGTGPAAVVSRAEALLKSGSLAEAVGELQALDGAPAVTAAPWLAEAKARLAADQALNDLTGTALAAVTASQTAPAAATDSK